MEFIKEISNLGLSMFIAVYFIVRLDRFMVKILYELKKMNGKGGDKK